MHRAVLVALSMPVAGIVGAQSPAAPSPEGPVSVAWPSLTPLIRPRTPSFPAMARVAGVQGQVTVKVLLGRNGAVAQAEAVDGPAMLRPAAEAWCRQWVFAPVEAEGRPVEAASQITLAFRMKDLAPFRDAPTGAVLEVEQSPAGAISPADLEAIRAEARAWLVRLGLAPVEAGQGDPARTLAVEVRIRLRYSWDRTPIYEVQARSCRLRDREQAFDPAGSRGLGCLSMHVVGLPGGSDTQAGLKGIVDQALGDLSEPRSIPEFLAKPRVPPPTGAPGRTGPADFDFSQIRVRYQPPPPPYPPEAKARHIQGTVVVELVVDPNGTPIRAEGLQGPMMLVETAIGYALRWRFGPALLNGVPQYARFKLTMPFRLG